MALSWCSSLAYCLQIENFLCLTLLGLWMSLLFILSYSLWYCSDLSLIYTETSCNIWKCERGDHDDRWRRL